MPHFTDYNKYLEGWSITSITRPGICVLAVVSPLIEKRGQESIVLKEDVDMENLENVPTIHSGESFRELLKLLAQDMVVLNRHEKSSTTGCIKEVMRLSRIATTVFTIPSGKNRCVAFDEILSQIYLTDAPDSVNNCYARRALANHHLVLFLNHIEHCQLMKA